MVAKLDKKVSVCGVNLNYKIVHDNLKIWDPYQINVSKRLRSEFYLKLQLRTTLFYIHWTIDKE